jgi:regulatory protein
LKPGNREPDAGNPKTKNDRRPRSPRKPGEPDSVEEARQRGLKLLTVRARGRSELTRILEDRGFATSAAREAVARLEREGWLDDSAAALSAARLLSGRYGRSRVRRELGARGFGREAIEAALAEVGTEAEEIALSRMFARLQQSLAGLSAEKRRRRLWKALTRRGFAGAAISAKMKGSGGFEGPDEVR